MVVRTSVIRNSQFLCLAIRQSFRNLLEQYMELKQKENNVKESNKIILPGYMDINPRNKAIEMYHSSIYRKKFNTNDSNVVMLVLWFSYTKYLIKCVMNCILSVFSPIYPMKKITTKIA
jgi:hypothetical protein